MRRRPFRLAAVVGLSLLAACGDSAVTSPTKVAPPSAPNDLLSISLGGISIGGTTSTSTDPKLLYCPSYLPKLSLTGLIGIDGGILSVGAVRLEVPPGAVLVPTLFELAVPPSKYMEVSLTAVGLEQFIFQKPVTVTIDYSRCSTSAVPAGATIEAVHILPLWYRILEEMGGTVDPTARTVTFTTGHFSSYAVAYRTTPVVEEP